MNPQIGFTHVVPSLDEMDTVQTKHCPQFTGSPLSYQLTVVDFNFDILTNLSGVPDRLIPSVTSLEFPQLPIQLITSDETCDNWQLIDSQKDILDTLRVRTLESASEIEVYTENQRDCSEWFQLRKFRITSCNAYGVYSRKRQFDTLAKQIAKPSVPLQNMPDVLRKKIKHGIKYESVAREKYIGIMKFKVCRNINVRDAGLVINPSLFWFRVSPDGLVVDGTASLPDGSLEVS